VSNLRSMGSLIALAILGGCATSTLTPSATHFDGSGSWTRIASSKGPFIYAAAYDGYVNIFTFSGEKVGFLNGFGEATGICSDVSGDIYVLDSQRHLIYEYHPSGSLPIDVLDDRYHTPSSCAADPTTGNLAVANGDSANGNLVIYPPGYYQTPTSYTAPNMVSYSFCTYDQSGNLYVDGTGPNDELELAVLPAGSTQFVAVPLSGINNHRHKPAGVQWDGQYLAVGDRKAKVIYRIAVSGSSGTIVQTVPIGGWFHEYGVGFAIAGKKLLFPLFEKLLFYKYPSGGRHTTGFVGDVGLSITVTSSQ
jgi:hypothetical protein